jgi:hypothetical protein
VLDSCSGVPWLTQRLTDTHSRMVYYAQSRPQPLPANTIIVKVCIWGDFYVTKSEEPKIDYL